MQLAFGSAEPLAFGSAEPLGLHCAGMDICHEHNLNRDLSERRRFGVRVRMTAADPLHRLLGGDLERTHWFVTAVERDRALADMASEHRYSRRGDRPTLYYEPVERS